MDLYCERTGPGLLAEPFNTFTNLAFLIAACQAWTLARRLNALTAGTRFLIILVVCIFAGSTLFHSFAAGWANFLDVGPILLFQLCYLWLYVRLLMEKKMAPAVASVLVLLAAVYFAQQLRNVLNGSLLYAPALILLAILGIYHFHQEKQGRRLLLIATGVLIISLFFRTIDRAICPYLPLGTHFIWHLLNGVVLFLVLKAFLLNRKNSSSDSSAAENLLP